MNSRTIGVDLGATSTKIGVIEDSVLVDELTFRTSSKGSKEKIILELIEGIEKIAGSDFLGIGIGAPGLIDEEQGIIYDLWNIPSWKEVPLKEQLEKHFLKPVKITNDANVFALGEKIFGIGRVYSNFVGVTMGTGFGTGIIIRNKLYSGAFSGAGEVGSLPYLDKTFEDYCSGKFFVQQHGIQGEKLGQLAQNGDHGALKIFEEFGYHVGNAVKLLMNILSPEAILLGGSISKSYDYFEKSLLETVDTFPFKRVRNQLVILPSDISNVAILGAAALVLSDSQLKEPAV